MRANDLNLELDDTPGLTLVHRVARTLRKAIHEGRLQPGMALPGSRILATMLGVHRQTIVPAFQELEAEGWLVAKACHGTFVATDLPSFDAVGQGIPEAEPSLGFQLPSYLKPLSTLEEGALRLADGVADPRLAPSEGLALAYQRALRRHGPDLLGGKDVLGSLLLRQAIATWTSLRLCTPVSPERVLVTRGSRGGLNLLASCLFRPGDAVLVENPGNGAAWEILQRDLGLRLVPVPVDAEGLCVDGLEDILDREAVKGIYVTPRCQFPTGVPLSEARAARLVELAGARRIAIIEDDYDAAIHYTAQRPSSLLARDRTGQVVHLGSLSRLLAPGLRLGYLILPEQVMPFVARKKASRGDLGDPAFEWAVGDLFRDGDLGNHVRRVRRTYMERRDHLVRALASRLDPWLEAAAPPAGMGLWIRVRQPLDAEELVARARAMGLLLDPPSRYFFGAPEPAFRMGFSQADAEELDRAVDILAAAVKATASRQAPR